MVVVTHEMAFMRDMANRVCFMEAGLIVEQSSAAEVFQGPLNPRTRGLPELLSWREHRKMSGVS